MFQKESSTGLVHLGTGHQEVEGFSREQAAPVLREPSTEKENARHAALPLEWTVLEVARQKVALTSGDGELVNLCEVIGEDHPVRRVADQRELGRKRDDHVRRCVGDNELAGLGLD